MAAARRSQASFAHVKTASDAPPIRLAAVMETPVDSNIYFDSVLVRVVGVAIRVDHEAPMPISGLPRIKDITLIAECEGESKEVKIKIFRDGFSAIGRRLGPDPHPTTLVREDEIINTGMNRLKDLLQARLLESDDNPKNRFVEVVLPLRKTAPSGDHDIPLIAHQAGFVVSELVGIIPLRVRIIPRPPVARS